METAGDASTAGAGRRSPKSVVVSRAQKISLGVAAVVLIAAGLTLAYLAGRNNGSDAAASSGATSAASSDLPPVTLGSIQVSGGASGGGGWGSGVTLVFTGSEAAKPTVAKGSATGEYDVKFDRPVTIAQSQLDAVGTDADQLLMKLAWDATTQTLSITATAWTSAISRTETGTDGAQSSIVLVRTPTPKLTNKCITVSEPAPYTKLNGITTVSGKAQLFEAGPMTILARAPGKGTTSTKVKTASSAEEPFTKDVNLPLLDAPEEGYISAFEPSAKDGSPTCEVDVPVYMSPGG
jgi:hypothetical protein